MKAARAMQRREYPFPTRFDPSRYQLAYLLAGWSEAAVQEHALALLRARRAFVEPVDAGAAPLRGRAIGALRRAGVRNPEAQLWGRTGVRKGLVDIVGCLDGGRAVFIEVKKPARYELSAATGRPVIRDPAGEPTPEQLAFLEAAHGRGALVGVIWAPSDVLEFLEGVPR